MFPLLMRLLLLVEGGVPRAAGRQGAAWQPPGIVPVRNARAQDVTRRRQVAGNGCRTDDQAGRQLSGAARLAYWNLLEYPKPIQLSGNLWPDTQSTYFLSRFACRVGATLTLRAVSRIMRFRFAYALQGRAGHARVYRRGSVGKAIAPDPASTNPFGRQQPAGRNRGTIPSASWPCAAGMPGTRCPTRFMRAGWRRGFRW